MSFKKIIKINPSFDKRNTDPKKNYGIGAVQINFFLIGKKGVIQFTMSSGIYLPHLNEHDKPLAYDIGYHSPHAMYEGQHDMPCSFIEGGRCYYDGSSLRADRYLDILIEKGSDGVWEAMKCEYYRLFGKHKHKD